jgi:hypothetical protein
MRGVESIQSFGAERGTTLVELLVILAAGMIVFTALFTILDVTGNQTSRVISRVDATQQARTAIAKLEGQLNSSCTGTGTPIQPESTSDTLVFYTAYGSDPQPIPQRHVVTYTQNANGTHGSLVEDNYTTTDTVAPFSSWSLASTDNLLGDVAQDGSKPVFQYFGYETPVDSSNRAYLDQNNNQYLMLLDGTENMPSDAKHASGTSAGGETPYNAFTPLGFPNGTLDTNAAKAAEVQISFVAYPNGSGEDNPNFSTSGATINDTVGLRLTPPANHAGSDTETPCA